MCFCLHQEPAAGVTEKKKNKKPLDDSDNLNVQVAEQFNSEVRVEQETADGEKDIESKMIDPRNEYMQDEAYNGKYEMASSKERRVSVAGSYLACNL